MKKIVCLLLVLMLAIPTVAVLAEGAAPEPVTLKWLIASSAKKADSDEVWAKFNEELQAYMPGTTLEFETVPFGEYAERWQLTAASGEKCDIAWFGWMQSLQNEVYNGSYLELDSLITDYAPELFEEIPMWVYDTMRIKGSLYAIPCYQSSVTVPWGFCFPTELADEYLDIEGFKTAYQNSVDGSSSFKTPEMMDILTDYLAKLDEAGKLGLGACIDYLTEAGRNTWYELRLGATIAPAFARARDESSTIHSFLDNADDELEYLLRVSDWYSKGYIRKDALTVEDWTTDMGIDGGYVIWRAQYNKFSEEQLAVKYGRPITIISYDYAKAPMSAQPTALVLPRTCVNPQRAIEFLGLMNSEKGKSLYNLLVYGIEGEHYTFTDDTHIQTAADVADRYGIEKWAIGNTYYAYETQNDIPGYLQYERDDLNNNAVPMPLTGFAFDQEPVAMELAQWIAIMDEYQKDLYYGANQDVTKTLETRNQRLRNAGADKIVVELQKQIDEFKAESGK
ncbi:ABC transporter substrate-binding protein [Clostridia bacterium]|nr:ABC transporter substrate-binding protein [Clostridia bacterium]